MNQAYTQFNLKILQLPAPSSNMTKAEYKEAYGIDLDEANIKAFKLVLFGNEKYPIDQIKEVEGGYEIYFNGRILSITDIVQTSNEVYDVANSKPIYFHPITIYEPSTSLNKFKLALIILDNSPTPYNVTSLKTFIDNLYTSIGDTVRIILTGAFFNSENSKMGSVSWLSKTSVNYILSGIYADGSSMNFSKSNFNDIIPLDSVVDDGVNKIN